MPGFIATARRRDPAVHAAFQLAVEWCEGHNIDGAPAIRHAVTVARTLGTHCPDAPGYVVAALLLHDAPDLAPDTADMEQLVTDQAGPHVLAFIHHLHAEHTVLDDPHEDAATAHLATLTGVPWLAAAAVADKLVALDYVTGRAQQSRDAEEFWAGRPAFTQLIPYFHHLGEATAGAVPASMSSAYRALLDCCPPLPVQA